MDHVRSAATDDARELTDLARHGPTRPSCSDPALVLGATLLSVARHVALARTGDDNVPISLSLVTDQRVHAAGNASVKCVCDVKDGRLNKRRGHYSVYRHNMIDLHCHILPGLDDGVRTLTEARAIARREAGEGVTVIVATPHVRDDYPTMVEQMESAVAALRNDFAIEGIQVDVVPGAEVDVSFLWQIPPKELTRFTLAGTGHYLLVEFPYWGWPAALDLAISLLRGRGICPVLAHPERNPEVQDQPDRLTAAVESGALVQVTAASLDGRLGPAPRLAVEKLLSLGLVHALATDAHGPHVRDAGLVSAIAAIGDPSLARWLTTGVPGAIVSGDSIPARP